MIKIDDSEFQKPIIVPLCLICNRSFTIEEPSKCEAFPDGIPEEILSGDFIHVTPYKAGRGDK